MVLLIVITALVLTTPWRRLPPSAQLWAGAGCLNTLVFFAMPTTPATSPWRPVVSRVLALSAAFSVVAVLLGVGLRRRHAVAHLDSAWAAPLIIAALPGLLYAFFWAIGPLY